MMTKQAVFDRVAAHLLTQRARSFVVGRRELVHVQSCAYRGVNGLRCAVGCLIADEAYHPDLETKSVCMPEVLLALSLSGVPMSINMTMLLQRLQAFHDGVHPHLWRDGLIRLASECNLSPRVVEEFAA
jgi:hypothetical protein